MILLALICLLPIGYYFYSERNTQDKKQSLEDKFYLVLPKLMDKLSERWTQGDIEGLYGTDKFKCSNLVNNIELYDSTFLECNPEYLKCFFNSKLDGVSPILSIGEFKFSLLSKIDQASNGDVYFSLIDNLIKKKISINLKQVCHKLFLPKNIYSAGPENEQGFYWDNYHSDIFVDKYVVTNYDVWLWQNRSDVNWSKAFYPSVNLTMKERDLFCQSRQGELLESRVMDAASFYPSKLTENYIFKYPFPWTKQRNTFLTQDIALNKSHCEQAYVFECKKLVPLQVSSPSGLSWIGITNTIGGYSESFKNINRESANLKVSSQHLSRKSLWHRLGQRANWKGERFEKRDFDLIEQYSRKEIEREVSIKEVAFRCMYYR